MATTSNPFEPPRTTDLDGDSLPPKRVPLLSEEALRELIAAAPWVRWMAHMTAASIVVGLIGGVADLVGSASVGAKARAMFGVAVSTLVSTLLLVAVRRYAAASERLRAGMRETAEQAVDAQAAYLGRMGVLTAAGIGLLLLLALVFIVAKILSS